MLRDVRAIGNRGVDSRIFGRWVLLHDLNGLFNSGLVQFCLLLGRLALAERLGADLDELLDLEVVKVHEMIIKGDSLKGDPASTRAWWNRVLVADWKIFTRSRLDARTKAKGSRIGSACTAQV